MADPESEVGGHLKEANEVSVKTNEVNEAKKIKHNI